MDLIPSLDRFRLKIHLHRRTRTPQSFFRSYGRNRAAFGANSACGRTSPGEFDVFDKDHHHYV